jgi:hypothetical protein
MARLRGFVEDSVKRYTSLRSAAAEAFESQDTAFEDHHGTRDTSASRRKES